MKCASTKRFISLVSFLGFNCDEFVWNVDTLPNKGAMSRTIQNIVKAKSPATQRWKIKACVATDDWEGGIRTGQQNYKWDALGDLDLHQAALSSYLL